MDNLESYGLAPLGGKVSWNDIETWKCSDITFHIQTPKKYAIATRYVYDTKPFRIVAIKSPQWAGRVVAECENEGQARDILEEIKDMMQNGFEESVTQQDLRDGDVISVPTEIGGRHYGVYIEESIDNAAFGFVYEYQGDVTSGLAGHMAQACGLITKIACGTTGKIVKTPFDAFRQRVEEIFHNFDLRRAKYLQELQADVVCERAKSRLGHKEFHILLNNCETYATWCKTGVGRSAQAAHWFEWATDKAEKGGAISLILAGLFVVAKFTPIGLIVHKWIINTFGIGHDPIFIKFFAGAFGLFGLSVLLFSVGVRSHKEISSGKNYEQL